MSKIGFFYVRYCNFELTLYFCQEEMKKAIKGVPNGARYCRIQTKTLLPAYCLFTGVFNTQYFKLFFV